MKVFFKRWFSAVFLFFLFGMNLAGQTAEDNSVSNPLEGIWENGSRFAEITKSGGGNPDEINIKLVLKTYYTYVYDNSGSFSAVMEKKDGFDSVFNLTAEYPFFKKKPVLPVCAENNALFTSFYEKTKYESAEETLSDEFLPEGIDPEKADYALNRHTSLLYGFWVEQGSPNGLLLYPPEEIKSLDAYFFTENEYIRFRYWLDDLAYNDKTAHFTDAAGNSYQVPKLIERNGLVYSCITSNGRVLRNYEKGTYTVKTETDLEGAEKMTLTLNPSGAGPGSNAAADTYPNPQFPLMENVPLYVLDGGKVFSLGKPYLTRSKVENLDEEIKAHNSKKRKRKSETDLQ